MLGIRSLSSIASSVESRRSNSSPGAVPDRAGFERIGSNPEREYSRRWSFNDMTERNAGAVFESCRTVEPRATAETSGDDRPAEKRCAVS
ncbi:hypothetical protein C491_18889 [Natronococcus amylolyticus DSM 10524]|uniref:Uncharacterized protein n=1 Tax=Natronococcus amylolyticus DSM 10524 TaxID=1227497 RepID=L9WZT1_9EURY|nr:hypothetical protein C491_18889 [Natronococcus amylolyticus DSM 10524]